MKRPMTGFGTDEEGDWFAYLGCGHRQHVRHRPPFINRPWVITRAGRNSRIGHELNCVRCDRLELPDSVIRCEDTPGFTAADMARAQARSNEASRLYMWTRVVVTNGALRYRIPEIDIDGQATPDEPVAMPPRVVHRFAGIGVVSFHLEIYRVPPVTPE